MSNKAYDIFKLVALIIVPVVNFVFLVLTTCKVMDAQVATTIIGGVDALVGAIVAAAKAVYDKKNKEDK